MKPGKRGSERTSSSSVDDPRFWQERYEQGGDGWELGRPSPPLARVLRTDPPPAGRAAVLGCGRGHDARLLARHGFDVIGYDFAEAAVAEARKLGGRFERRDIFAIARDRSFDLVWEYTCFCAIDPRRRGGYADVVRGLLRPGGTLLALFYPLKRGTEGPPFPVTKKEVRALFARGFEWLSDERPRDSVARRRGFEWLVRLRRK